MAASNFWPNVIPIFNRAQELMAVSGKTESLADVKEAVSAAYREVFANKATQSILGKYGIASYADFSEMLRQSPCPALADIKRDIDK